MRLEDNIELLINKNMNEIEAETSTKQSKKFKNLEQKNEKTILKMFLKEKKLSKVCL